MLPFTNFDFRLCDEHFVWRNPRDFANRPGPLARFILAGFIAISAFGWQDSRADSQTKETSLTFLRNEVRKLLIQESNASSDSGKDAALTALCDLYVVLRQDKRYSESSMLQHDAQKIRSRLLNAARKRKNQLQRNDVPRPTGLATQVDSAIQKAIKDPGENLRDSIGNGNDSKQQGRAAAGGAFDNGWQLVELMQRVVEPDFWEVNGGPGAIHYFAMRRVLVVRATSDVHEQVRDLLLKLPR